MSFLPFFKIVYFLLYAFLDCGILPQSLLCGLFLYVLLQLIFNVAFSQTYLLVFHEGISFHQYFAMDVSTSGYQSNGVSYYHRLKSYIFQLCVYLLWITHPVT